MSSYQIFESDVDFNDEKPHPKPKPIRRKTPDELLSELLMWRARAKQNLAELRAAEAEHAAALSKANLNAKHLRLKLEATQKQLEELQGASSE